MASETALELDTDAAGYTRSEPVHFGGFPGLWEPGRPIAVAELGFESVDEALAVVHDLDLPLMEVQVDVGSAPMPARPNHRLSEEQQRTLDNEADANWPPKTHADAEELARAAGVEWPAGNMKVADKVAFLESVRSGAQTGEGDA